jgi:hypothetical protein
LSNSPHANLSRRTGLDLAIVSAIAVVTGYGLFLIGGGRLAGS